MPRIIKNAIECKLCGDVIESEFRHDFRSCKCGAVYVDGGKDYMRRGGNIENMIDRSIFEEEDND
jgi:hypothetical protein